MKKFLATLLFIGIIYIANAEQLIVIEGSSPEQIKQIRLNNELIIHYETNNLLIATAFVPFNGQHYVIDQNAWADHSSLYYLVWLNSDSEAYLAEMSAVAEIIHAGNDYVVVKIAPDHVPQLYPAVHGGLVPIRNKEVQVNTATKFEYDKGTLSARADIWAMMGEVDTVNLHSYVLQLQNYGTRNAYKPGGIQAQNWILSQFESYGLSAELHDFSMPSGAASDNVIATLTGTLYPDEYVVLGSHYDSYAGGANEPGADDNATGTAGILEIARIMSQYEFDRSIIFACWSGEEYGLYGSEAWANEAAQDGMNILGYFNIDMAGYLEPGDAIHTDIIAPASASDLVDFYIDNCAIYLPDFETGLGALSGGDSDHTSFNNAGYMGIFPFEDANNYSPYIHTANDLIGNSVNNFEQLGVFTQATLVNVASMADLLPTPDLAGTAGDGVVDLEWNSLEDVDHYNIYRNLETIPYASTQEVTFTDSDVTNYESYTYYVTAVFQESGEESGPSNLVTVVPMPPIALPFFDDYETGGFYWTLQGSWGLQSGIYHSATNALTESPQGTYSAGQDISATLRSIDMTGATSAQLSFWCRHQIESGYDYMYLEISADGNTFDVIDEFTGNQTTWTEKSYSLSNYLGEENVVIRFRFTSDNYVEDQGMFIDDFELNVNGVGITEPSSAIRVEEPRPNPADQSVTIGYYLPADESVSLKVINTQGKLIYTLKLGMKNKGYNEELLKTGNLSEGLYYLVIQTKSGESTVKVIVTH